MRRARAALSLAAAGWREGAAQLWLRAPSRVAALCLRLVRARGQSRHSAASCSPCCQPSQMSAFEEPLPQIGEAGAARAVDSTGDSIVCRPRSSRFRDVKAFLEITDLWVRGGSGVRWRDPPHRAMPTGPLFVQIRVRRPHFTLVSALRAAFRTVSRSLGPALHEKPASIPLCFLCDSVDFWPIAPSWSCSGRRGGRRRWLSRLPRRPIGGGVSVGRRPCGQRRLRLPPPPLDCLRWLSGLHGLAALVAARRMLLHPPRPPAVGVG